MPLPAKAVKQTREQVLAKLSSSPPRGAVAVSHRPRSLPRGAAAVNAINPPNPLVLEPLTLEQSRIRDHEMISARDRSLVNTERVTQECRPYIEEGNRIKQRIAALTGEIDRNGLRLDRLGVTLKDSHGLLGSSKENHKTHKNREYLFRLQTLYTIERLQKEEEIMRLRDRLEELNKIIRSIYRKYEDTRQFTGIGGRGTRSKTKKHKHKWSLKYKRSINCKHPKGFSQRQHCKYGRKNRTRRK
jgi:hypothetical protein